MNPLSGNPLKSRDDFARSVIELWNPLKPYFSEGRARVDISETGAHFTKAAAELEGFARPLFGLAPLAAGNLPFDDWEMIRTGYANGCDPDHPEYWGDVYDHDQRLVESAAIGFGLILARDKIWDPLTDTQKQNVGNWLKATLLKKTADNNWHFFHVLASLGLETCGVEHDMQIREDALVRLEEFYLQDGWYTDGIARRFDHYIPFAMHLYGLVYSKVAKGDEARCKRFRDRAVEFAQEFQHWFDENGANIPYGRSMTYRFAQASFWGGLAFADLEALPWGQIRGLWARNMRWWGERDWYDNEGVMPVGYLYPNLLMSEFYNSPGSPYWAMKSYFPLALPADHPFWTAEEEAKAEPGAQTSSAVSGTLTYAAGGARILMPAASEMRHTLRCGAEKYGKFAYSSAFGFSVDIERQGFLVNPFDNMLALSEDCTTYLIRSQIEDCHVGPDWLYSRWLPGTGVEIETWQIVRAPWHLRAHRVTVDRPYYAIEGGFAIERTDAEPALTVTENGIVRIDTAVATTLAADLSPVRRTPVAKRPAPNSSLYFPRTHVPHLTTRIEPGTHWFIGAWAASTTPADAETWLAAVPETPDTAWLESLVTEATRSPGLKFREGAPSDRFL